MLETSRAYPKHQSSVQEYLIVAVVSLRALADGHYLPFLFGRFLLIIHCLGQEHLYEKKKILSCPPGRINYSLLLNSLTF